MRRLLIVYHSQNGRTAAMAEAVVRGANTETGIECQCKRAFDTTIEDLLGCSGLLIGTPENFGYMSGAVKDFFDRTYYPVEGKTIGLPYGIFVSAGDDGTGAVREIGRIAVGYGWKQVADPIIAHKENHGETLQKCEALGAAMATGIAMGIY